MWLIERTAGHSSLVSHGLCLHSTLTAKSVLGRENGKGACDESHVFLEEWYM